MSGFATCVRCHLRYHCGSHPPQAKSLLVCGCCQWRMAEVDWAAVPARRLPAKGATE